MTAQPVHAHPSEVPRNADGIGAALSGERRMEFYRELLAASPEDAEAVLRRWWCEATLDADQAKGDRLTEAALSGTLPTHSVTEAIAAAGLPVE
ncbi:hypothetical protein [Streptomyces sp. V1I1]|uniref:hypothetical protein n=1 Tax=Streptomyces sp. V1I1 TaxID=3042272 RepID=UPI002785341D|nr:hypothetical protein [Streptomyces sp. V1I1]MDQ0938338.1 hypothetical protein [Streptomyces sp. V1I1]